MKKSMKKVISLMLVIVLVFSLTGCGKKGLVGTWTYDEGGVSVEYNFKRNGDLEMKASGFNLEGEYEVKGDKLIITVDLMGQKSEEEFEFKVSGKELTLTSGGVSQVLKKK